VASFHERFRRLQEQQDELHRQYRKLSQASRGEAQSRPPESAQLNADQEAAQAPKSSAPAGELFRKGCVKCHGADGTGSRHRERLPEIPDFTNIVWQRQRADRELLESILDGKGSDMPPQRGKIGEEQGRILVSFVRAFSPGVTQFKLAESAERDLARTQTRTVRAAPDCRELFLMHCAKCHGPDGKGTKVRDSSPDIPDFTKAEWQAQRTDEQLERSILDGKEPEMPPHRGRIDGNWARGLVRRVRDFAPASGKSIWARSASLKQVAADSEFRANDEPSPRALEKQEPVSVAPNPQAEPPRSLQRPIPQLSASENPEHSAVEALYRRHCVKCHGSDGTGNKKRSRWPEIPDFTDASWQARRTNAELTESIMDGKGSAMPPLGEDLGEEQASGLVVYVRAFGLVKGKGNEEVQGGLPLAATPGDSRQGQQERPTLAEPSDGETTPSFFDKLTRWIGKFHPPGTHFPIALLMSAAVAELLRVATGKPVFDGISRFCIWFGSLTAVGAGALGWCAGSFRMTDASWVLMTHRWLGTSTVVCAGLALVLSEASRLPGRHRTRICFRVALFVVALLVSATGFLGGAVVFGLKHYAWPQ
jgi:mono/diheme cytochrome c family protein/uncharacterized membrane protein